MRRKLSTKNLLLGKLIRMRECILEYFAAMAYFSILLAIWVGVIAGGLGLIWLVLIVFEKLA